MKLTTNKIVLPFVLLLVFVLAACSSMTPPTSEQPEAEQPAGSSAITTLGPGMGVQTTPLPTQEPVVLEGATTTDSGLQFLNVTAGDGAAPQDGDILTLHFTAALPDGTEFTNTRDEGDAVTMVYMQDHILTGMDEGLGMMKAGGTAKMVLPPELAFGEQGYYDMVPANSQVIMEVELLSVEKPPAPTKVDSADLKKTESGLQYADLVTGQGDAVEKDDIVSTNYTIWVQGEDNDQYITSSRGNDPLTFLQGAGDTVFPGWEEGVLGMQVGGKRYLVIPPELGLGDTGGGNIPPNATLVMEIELTDRQDQPELSRVPDDKLTTTDSGLAYSDIVTGNGDAVTTGQTVRVHYSGWLEDGKLFDSSIARGEPITFTLGQGSVIQGWEEGIVGMKVGGKRQLIIPASLAYGEEGAGDIIPANATLIFDIELLEIED